MSVNFKTYGSDFESVPIGTMKELEELRGREVTVKEAKVQVLKELNSQISKRLESVEDVENYILDKIRSIENGKA